MSDEPSFPSPKRSTKPPARPPGATDLKGKQKTLANIADRLFRRAREEGWSRRKFYNSINDLPGLKGLRKDIKDNLIDAYRGPKHPKLGRKIPADYTPRVIHDTFISVLKDALEVEADGAKYVIEETREGGYRLWIQPDSP